MKSKGSVSTFGESGCSQRPALRANAIALAAPALESGLRAALVLQQVTSAVKRLTQMVLYFNWLMDNESGSTIARTIELRPATIADLALLQHWDEQPHVIASDPNDDWHWEEELARTPDWRLQLIAEIDGRALGFIQIIDPAREDSHYWGDIAANLRAIDIWIGEATDLGKGYGTEMMQLALAQCFADPSVTAVLVDPLVSNTRVHRFYERLGFECIERRQFNDDDCFVYRLNREDWHPENAKFGR